MTSQRETFLQEMVQALGTGDAEYVAANITDDVQWTFAGRPPVQGKQAFLELLASLKGESLPEVTIDNIITHGVDAAANGTIKTPTKTFAFCDIFHLSGFKNGKVKVLTSYVIEVKS